MNHSDFVAGASNSPKSEPNPNDMYQNSAALHNDNIYVLVHVSTDDDSTDKRLTVWRYNLFTKEWTEFGIRGPPRAISTGHFVDHQNSCTSSSEYAPSFFYFAYNYDISGLWDRIQEYLSFFVLSLDDSSGSFIANQLDYLDMDDSLSDLSLYHDTHMHFVNPHQLYFCHENRLEEFNFDIFELKFNATTQKWEWRCLTAQVRNQLSQRTLEIMHMVYTDDLTSFIYGDNQIGFLGCGGIAAQNDKCQNTCLKQNTEAQNYLVRFDLVHRQFALEHVTPDEKYGFPNFSYGQDVCVMSQYELYCHGGSKPSSVGPSKVIL
ncbi:hypothetical protein Ddc_17571 [Ditylenchus destructor]|nr:hypothetical protein Ddc_17571 [Ditylenchus destructor]